MRKMVVEFCGKLYSLMQDSRSGFVSLTSLDFSAIGFYGFNNRLKHHLLYYFYSRL